MNKFARRKKTRKVIVFFVLIAVVIIFMDFQIRPVVKDISANKSRIISITTLNEAVQEDMIKFPEAYSGIVCAERGEDGAILAVTSDINKANMIKSRMSLIIQQRFEEFKNKDINISLGTLSGIEILNGRGPAVPLKIAMCGSVETQFKTEFLQAGINQTLHRIYLCVHTRISAVVPGCSCVTELDTNFLVAETVIVGKVPRVYAGGSSSELNHAALSESKNSESGES